MSTIRRWPWPWRTGTCRRFWYAIEGAVQSPPRPPMTTRSTCLSARLVVLCATPHGRRRRSTRATGCGSMFRWDSVTATSPSGRRLARRSSARAPGALAHPAGPDRRGSDHHSGGPGRDTARGRRPELTAARVGAHRELDRRRHLGGARSHDHGASFAYGQPGCVSKRAAVDRWSAQPTERRLSRSSPASARPGPLLSD